MKRYTRGDTVEIIATCSLAQVASDPGDMRLQIKDPNGAILSLGQTDLLHDGPGVFRYEYPVGIAGTYTYKLLAGGSIAAAIERQFAVYPSVF